MSPLGDLSIHLIEFRRRNAWRDGSVTATDSNCIAIAMDWVIETLGRLRDRFPAATDQRAERPIRRGVGCACGVHAQDMVA